MDSFPERVTDTCVNFYGSALDLNKDDGEEDLDIIIVEVRYFELPLHSVPNLFSTKAPELLLLQETENESVSCSFSGQCVQERGRAACPCKTANFNCANTCKCDKSK